MCLDPTIAVECGDRPPPLYVCEDCAEELRMEHAQYLVDILQPLQHVPLVCENKVWTCDSVMVVTSAWHASGLGVIPDQGRHGIFGFKTWLSTFGSVYPS